MEGRSQPKAEVQMEGTGTGPNAWNYDKYGQSKDETCRWRHLICSRLGIREGNVHASHSVSSTLGPVRSADKRIQWTNSDE